MPEPNKPLEEWHLPSKEEQALLSLVEWEKLLETAYWIDAVDRIWRLRLEEGRLIIILTPNTVPPQAEI